MKGLTIKETIEIIKKKCEELEITPYKINKDTGLSSKGVQKILDGITKKPRVETLDTILSYLESLVLSSELKEDH
jgi:predicted transcriptional regulator